MPLINDPDGLSQGGITAVSDAVFSGASGASVTITSAGANLPAVTAGDYVEVRDHSTGSVADEGNNGLYLVTGSPTTSSIAATKLSLTGTPVNPANGSSEAIRIFGSNANEKNIHFDVYNLLFTFLNGFGSTTVLDNAGVEGQALYSFIKEEWIADSDLVKFIFPVTAITTEQFEFNRWRPVDESQSGISTGSGTESDTRLLIRTAGWDEVNADGAILASYFCAVTLGNIDSTSKTVGDRPYYFFAGDTAATEARFAGPMNEAVQTVYGGIAAPGAGWDIATSSITRDSGSFITDGFKVGDRVLVQSATNSANNTTATITNVAATVLTVSGSPFTASVDDTSALLAVDLRAREFFVNIRIFTKTYDQSTTTAIGVSSLQNKVERFPLSEGPDGVITGLGVSLADIITSPVAPYDDMSIAYFASAQTRSGFVSGSADFGVIIDADVSQTQQDGGGAATAEQVYAFVQARLQDNDTINAGGNGINDGVGAAAVKVIGRLAEPLLALASTGNTLSSLAQVSNPGGDGGGVYVDSFSSNDTNRIQFTDNTAATVSFPFIAAGTILFNSNLSTDTNAIYRMFFTNDDAGDNAGADFGTALAITVQDSSNNPIQGSVPQQAGGSSVSFSFAYSTNSQRGTGSEGSDAPITIVAIGQESAQYVVAQGTISQATGQTFSLVAPFERNYSNP